MATFVNQYTYLLLNSVDLSDHIAGATLTQKFDEQEVTNMTDTGHRFVKGLESATLQVDFLNDLVAGKTLQTLQAAYGTSVPFVLMNNGSVASTSNPKYTGNVLVNNLTPVVGKIGDLSVQSVQFTVNGAVTYATA